MNNLTARYSLVGLMIFVSLGLIAIGSPDSIAQSAASTPTLFPAATLIPVGTSNKVWIPQEQDFNGVTMVLVPAGCFLMGIEDGNRDRKPIHEVCFDQPFWIGKYEITNADFQHFADAGGYTSPSYWSEAGWLWRNENNINEPETGCTEYSSAPEQPRLCITWYEAEAYAAWWGGRLPTEAEWEYAARGPEGLVFPWGNDFVEDNAVYAGNSGDRTASVGSRPSGASWVGALDMSGNVWECVADWYNEDYYASSPTLNPQGPETGDYRVQRGGSWYDYEDSLRTPYRNGYLPRIRHYRGIRVALSY